MNRVLAERMKEKLENGESILEVAKRVKATESEVEANKVYKILSLDISLEEMRTRLINLFSEESSNRKSYPEIKNYKGLNEFNRMHNNRIFNENMRMFSQQQRRDGGME
jgi:hypothetical protein